MGNKTSAGSSSTLKACLTDGPTLNTSTKIKFQAEKPPAFSAFTPRNPSPRFSFIFTATGTGLRYDDKIILKKDTNEITSDCTWTDTSTRLLGQMHIPWDAETGSPDVLSPASKCTKDRMGGQVNPGRQVRDRKAGDDHQGRGRSPDPLNNTFFWSVSTGQSPLIISEGGDHSSPLTTMNPATDLR